MPNDKDDLDLALKRLELKDDPAAVARIEAKGRTLTDVAAELVAMEAERRSRHSRTAPAPKRLITIPRESPSPEAPKPRLDRVMHHIIHAHGPLLRSEVFERARRVPGVENALDGSMGNAITSLIKQGKVEWAGDQKPRPLRSLVPPEEGPE